MNNFDLHQLDEDRDKYGLSAIRNGYLQFKGYTMPESFRHMLNDIEEFEVYDDDVWVTSYPKCGTTWTQEIVWCMSNNFDFKTAQETDLDLRFPFLEYEACFYTEDQSLLAVEPGIVHKSVYKAANKPRPRFIKSHLPWDLLPKKIRTFERRPKIIHVARNPKDVCVSYFHHSRLMEGYTGDFQLFWKLFISGKLNYAPMFQNVLSYWHRRTDGVLFIKYEDMKTNITKVIKDIARFLNKPMSDEQLEALKHHVSFDVMKDNKSTHHGPVVEYLRKCGAVVDGTGSFMRSGKAGAYKELMSDDIEKVFDEWMRNELDNADLRL